MKKCQGGVSAGLVTLSPSAPEVVSKTCFTVIQGNINEKFYLSYSVPPNPLIIDAACVQVTHHSGALRLPLSF